MSSAAVRNLNPTTYELNIGIRMFNILPQEYIVKILMVSLKILVITLRIIR